MNLQEKNRNDSESQLSRLKLPSTTAVSSSQGSPEPESHRRGGSELNSLAVYSGEAFQQHKATAEASTEPLCCQPSGEENFSPLRPQQTSSGSSLVTGVASWGHGLPLVAYMPSPDKTKLFFFVSERSETINFWKFRTLRVSNL